MSLFVLIRELVPRHFWAFTLLIGLLLFEGIFLVLSVLSVSPIAEFLMNPDLQHPSAITQKVMQFFKLIGVTPNFNSFAMVFIFGNVLTTSISIPVRYAVLRVKLIILRRLFKDSLKAFLNARWSFFTDIGKGILLNTFQRELLRIGDALALSATLLSKIIQFFFYLVAPLFLVPQLVLVSIVTLIILLTPFLFSQRLSQKIGVKETNAGNVNVGTLKETLEAIKIIIGFGRQQYALKRYLKVFDWAAIINLKADTFRYAVKTFVRPMAIISAMVGMGIALKSGEPIPEIAAGLWGMLRALGVVGEIVAGKTSIDTYLPSYNQLLKLRAQAEHHQDSLGNIPFDGLKKGIRLENVSFAYLGRNQTLENINIFIPKNKMVALVGASGAGKSTLIDIIVGLLKPNQGKVWVDDYLIERLDTCSFRESIGYVPQDSFLFNDTIRENLCWSLPDAKEEDIWEACQLANADQFIRKLPKQLSTIVGDRGISLSGGQRQRVALARAIIRKPDLLILDEATSALDTESERLIQQSIDSLAGEMTIVVIAHRLSTICNANYVYVLHDGKVVEKGSYQELSGKTESKLSKMIVDQVL